MLIKALLMGGVNGQCSVFSRVSDMKLNLLSSIFISSSSSSGVSFHHCSRGQSKIWHVLWFSSRSFVITAATQPNLSISVHVSDITEMCSDSVDLDMVKLGALWSVKCGDQQGAQCWPHYEAVGGQQWLSDPARCRRALREPTLLNNINRLTQTRTQW